LFDSLLRNGSAQSDVAPSGGVVIVHAPSNDAPVVWPRFFVEAKRSLSDDVFSGDDSLCLAFHFSPPKTEYSKALRLSSEIIGTPKIFEEKAKAGEDAA
jgi:hypothetical protein